MRRFETGVFGEFNLAFFHQSSQAEAAVLSSAMRAAARGCVMLRPRVAARLKTRQSSTRPKSPGGKRRLPGQAITAARIGGRLSPGHFEPRFLSSDTD